ncbi:hypothetical protein RSAG8_05622, partial [Rhizoctonia solani AG-8 WAC10335]
MQTLTFPGIRRLPASSRWRTLSKKRWATKSKGLV